MACETDFELVEALGVGRWQKRDGYKRCGLQNSDCGRHDKTGFPDGESTTIMGCLGSPGSLLSIQEALFQAYRREGR